MSANCMPSLHQLQLPLFPASYLHCTAVPSSLWHRNSRRGLGDRTRKTCIPLVHYTFLYRSCQTCVARKLWKKRTQRRIQSQTATPRIAGLYFQSLSWRGRFQSVCSWGPGQACHHGRLHKKGNCLTDSGSQPALFPRSGTFALTVAPQAGVFC